MNFTKPNGGEFDLISRLSSKIRKGKSCLIPVDPYPTDIEEQKEINRNTFKIRRHLNRNSQDDVILKFKNILSACLIENVDKRKHIKSLGDLEVEHARARNVMPFTELVSQKMKHQDFNQTMARVSREIQVEENQRECLVFAYKRIADDLGILKVNINRHAYFLLKLGRNQAVLDRLRTVYRFNTFVKDTKLKHTVVSVKRLMSEGNQKKYEKTEFEKRQKQSICTLEQDNAVMQLRMKNSLMQNENLWTQIFQLEKAKDKHKNLNKSLQIDLSNYMAVLRKLLEFSIMKDFQLFRKAFVSCLDCNDPDLEILDGDAQVAQEILDLIEKVKVNEVKRKVKKDQYLKQLYDDLRKSINNSRSRFKNVDLQLIDFKKTETEGFGELLNLQILLGKLSVCFMTKLSLAQYAELNNTLQQNIKYFEEFQKHLGPTFAKLQEEKERLSAINLSMEPEVNQEPLQEMMTQKKKALQKFESAASFIFSLQNYLVPFGYKMQQIATLINNASRSGGVYFQIKFDWPDTPANLRSEFCKRKTIAISNLGLKQVSTEESVKLWMQHRFPFLEVNNDYSDDQGFGFYNQFIGKIKGFFGIFTQFDHGLDDLRNRKDKCSGQNDPRSVDGRTFETNQIKHTGSKLTIHSLKEGRRIDGSIVR